MSDKNNVLHHLCKQQKEDLQEVKCGNVKLEHNSFLQYFQAVVSPMKHLYWN